jgi:hypothetical protein
MVVEGVVDVLVSTFDAPQLPHNNLSLLIPET